MLAKQTKHLSLVDILSVAVDRMQRNFEPMRKQVEAWKGTRLSDESAKLVIYKAFVEGRVGRSQALGPTCPRCLFQHTGRGIHSANDMESLECVHECVQGTRSDPAVQGDGKACVFSEAGGGTLQLIMRSRTIT